MGFFNFEKTERTASPVNPEQAENKEEFGRNIKVVVELKRHQDPGKTPEGMSADWLTEKGQAAAAADGAAIKEANVKGYASPKLRAQETVDLMLQNVDDDVKVINKSLDALAGTGAAVGERVDKERDKNEFNVRTRKELDATANFNKIMPIASAWADEQIKAGAKLDKYSLIVQWYLDNPEKCQENGVLDGHETATEIGERVAVELGMASRLKSGSEVRLVNVTHGPKIEPFLHEVIGFKNLEEIGGALKPGESLEFAVNIDNDKSQSVKLLFRGREYPLGKTELDLIESFSQEYRDRLEGKK